MSMQESKLASYRNTHNSMATSTNESRLDDTRNFSIHRDSFGTRNRSAMAVEEAKINVQFGLITPQLSTISESVMSGSEQPSAF
jgi:hypothetical protein